MTVKLRMTALVHFVAGILHDVDHAHEGSTCLADTDESCAPCTDEVEGGGRGPAGGAECLLEAADSVQPNARLGDTQPCKQ